MGTVLRSLLALIVILLSTPLIAMGAILWTLLPGGGEIDLRPARLWARICLSAAGIRVSYEGLEHGAGPLPRLFVANHQSNVDIWALVCALPISTKFVAKRSLFRVPFMGWAMRRAGFVPIDRDQRGSAIESLRSAVARIHGGRSVVVFPEGTRSRDGRLLPFKKGPFHLALQAGVPVVPVAISGSWATLPPGAWRLRPGEVRVRLLPAIDVAPFLPDDYRGLTELAHRRIAAALPAEATPSTGTAPLPVGTS